MKVWEAFVIRVNFAQKVVLLHRDALLGHIMISLTNQTVPNVQQVITALPTQPLI
jgi:hypothetical protein